MGETVTVKSWVLLSSAVIVMVCGKVKYRVDWSFTEVFDYPTPYLDPAPRLGTANGPGGVGNPTGQTADAMDPDHEAALENFNAGKADGAPVQ